MHWVTHWRHSDLLWAATSASSQVIPILNKSLLTVLLHAVCMQTTWNCLKPRNLPVQRLSRYALVIHSYHMSKPAESSFTEHVIHTALSSSDSDFFIWCSFAFSAFNVAGPVCWNSLPDYLKSSDLSFDCFRQQLKHFYFVNIDTSPSTTLAH